ncbi:MAG TPA: GNAT family N-acetyltransferase [Rectinemataceae bacterium]|nr:GNAT family N-acetyltransferase [Rectinemataceae bacterium]
MRTFVIAEAEKGEANAVFDLVESLLSELVEEGEETGALDREALSREWEGEGGRHRAFLASSDGAYVGVITITEAFALYAGGRYGIINEMYVKPGFRSVGLGSLLVDAAKSLGRQRGWRRIDVTAPESERWDRSRRFYEREGFRFTGPKLKYLL